FFPAELAKKYRDDENRILETGRGIYDHESPMIDSGVEKWVSTVKVPLRDGMGKITGFVGLDKDITSRRQAEQEFRLKSAALQAAANGIIITDASGSIIWANQAFVRQTGYSEEEVVDRNPRELLKSGKHDREFYGKMWENILAGQVWQGELINRRKDGSLYYEEMTITPIVDQGGKITHFIAIKQDITRRKQAEESFKLASQELENLHNNLQEAIFSFDPVNNKMLVVSIAHEKIFGYPREDFINNPRFWYELILPEDRPIVDAGYPALNAGNSIQHEVRIRRGDGQIRWIEAHAHPRYDENENLIRIDGFTTDVTDRKLIENALLENELNLNRAQALAHIGSWMVNMADNKLTWSPETYRIFGLPSGKELTFNDYLSFVHPDDRDFVSQTSLDSLKGEPYDIEYRILSGKKVKWVRVVAEVEADELGTIFKRIGTVQDITERKFAEEKIRLLNIDLEHRIYQRTSELEEANKELESFAYSVSHDLRTPLRSIAGFGAILRNEHSGSLDEDGKNLLDTVIKNTVKMGQLIDNLLEFSRMARKEMKIGKVNMDRIATEVLKEMISLEQNRKIEYEIDSLIPCLGDNAMLHHVWSNLISNALKYSRKKELTKVEIGSRLENGTILYFIRDNGSGFDMRYYHKLFGVFQRLHSINEFEGTGVGLAFVKRIVNRHGGKVWAEGKSGEGAVFYFSIPDEAPMNTESGKG
ncbi:MAG TPA: PAS domain S-box protein, partial [Cyclobacteriaceae bacterium]|nr:PAS domain S-box protein [Cyclobacteriaceae bacterium]